MRLPSDIIHSFWPLSYTRLFFFLSLVLFAKIRGWARWRGGDAKAHLRDRGSGERGEGGEGGSCNILRRGENSFLFVDCECNRPSFLATVFQSSVFNRDLNQWDVAKVTTMRNSKSPRI